MRVSSVSSGVERRSENLALTQTDHIAVDRRFDRGPLANLGNERSANEHQREILEHNRLGSGTFRNALPGATETAKSPVAEPKSAVATNEPS